MKRSLLILLACLWSPHGLSAQVTISGNLTATAGTNSVKASTPGPNPWFDVSDPNVNGGNPVDCTGATDSSAKFNNILTVAAANPQGAKVYLGCRFKVSSFSVSQLSNVTIIGNNGGLFGASANYDITVTCTTGPCINMQSASSIIFQDLAINFPSVASGYLVDGQPCGTCGMSGSGPVSFHHVYLNGPGATSGVTAFLLRDVNDWLVDGWSHVNNVSTVVNGATSNADLSDQVTFRNDQFAVIGNGSGSGVIQNPSVNWTFQDININPVSACTPILTSTVSGQQVTNFNWINSSVTGEPSCNSAFTMFTLPATTASGATGGAFFAGGLILANAGTGAMTLFNLGNSQSVSMHGMNICFENSSGIFASVGSGTTFDVTGNQWSSSSACHAPATIFSGSQPQTGIVEDPSGITTMYSGTNQMAKFASAYLQLPFGVEATGLAPALSGTGPCATPSAFKGGSWSGQFTCTGTTGASAITITPGSTSPNGWSCSASDITHTLAGSESGLTTTTCTISFASVSTNDVITFTAIPY